MKDKLLHLTNAPAPLTAIPKGWQVHRIIFNAGQLARLEFQRFSTYYTATFSSGGVKLERGEA